jgi:uncharacterized membrane protein YvlD (DUF360 family)
MRSPLHRLVAFYGLQLRLVRTWRLGPRALVRRLVLSTVIAYLAFLAAVALVRGITATNPASILGAIVVIGLLNTLLRPVLLALVVPLGILVLGVVGTALQFALFLAVGSIVPGVHVADVTAAVEGAVVFAVVNTSISWFIALGEEESYFSQLIRLLIRDQAGVERTDQPGVLIVQIDGLSHPVLVNQIRAGRVPTMARLVRSGSHRLDGWDCQLPSQTSASQAGILLGANDGIPAFRWYEKASGRLLVSNHPPDATEIERRLSTGRGLLAGNGSSVGNLISGDAPDAILTMSRLEDRTAALGPTRDWFYFFASPFAFARAVLLSIGEAAKEIWQARRQRVAGIEPRIDRGGSYPLLRAFTNVLLRQVIVSLLVERILRGVPVIYVDFNDYDEIAHHSGPERGEALDALDGIDGVLGALQRVALEAPRPYRFMVVSDHGQSQGSTFRQRYGMTIGQVIGDLIGDGQLQDATSTVESWGPLNAFLTELGRGLGLGAGAIRWLFRRRSTEGQVELGPGRSDATPDGSPDRRPELVVCASGNLALVYLNARPERLTLEALESLFPGLVEALAQHEGIGFVLVRSEREGALAIGAGGRNELDHGRVVGVDPLAPFGPDAAEDLRRLDAMPNVGDIVLNSRLDPDTQEVAAFEELVGSHGGLGGWQTSAFILHPADWALSANGRLLGAPAVYTQLVSWLEKAGIREANGKPLA